MTKHDEGEFLSEEIVKYTGCELGQWIILAAYKTVKPDPQLISWIPDSETKMQKIIIFAALLGCALAAPVYDAYVPLGKSTLTSSSQVVDHGSTHVLHAPLLAHEEYHIPLGKSTLTQSSQVVNHGSTALVHAPLAHAVVAHAPVAHAVVAHAPVYHAPVYSVHSPVVYKTPDSAVTHHSSSTHETVNSVPFYAFH